MSFAALCGNFQLWLLVIVFAVFNRIFTLYAKALSLDVASRVWDVFFRDGEEFLFRTAIGAVLKLFSSH